ncbi:MAG: hypothetical protein R3E12_03075 [Candidatus Eisenbacteria bacterium]
MFQLSLKNLLRNKRRTFLTGASVSLTLILVCLLGAVLTAMESAEGSADNRIVVRSAISSPSRSRNRTGSVSSRWITSSR